MAYEKKWATNEKLSKFEKAKLETDGLDIFKDIRYYAEKGFDSIPKDKWDFLKWAGLYLQKPKEDGYFMMRVKVPTGILNYDQVVTLAGISRDYGRGIFDITTRQAIQFHWITIENVPDILQRLEKVGLSSSGACGDIPRNVIGNPLAGIDPNELIDTEPIVNELHHFFLNNRDFSNLPRKYKISVSASIHNPGHAEINDLAFVPATKVIHGEEVVGFHVKVGGGLSSMPFLAEELDIFVRPEQVKEVAVAVTTIFRDYGYREKRHRARLKFLVADWGAERFKEKLLELTGPLPERGVSQLQEWNAGYFYGVHKQKQEGLNYIGLNVPVGRLTAEEVFDIARISKQYGNGEIRTCNSQNLIIPNIPDEHVDAVLSENVLKRISVNPKPFMAYSVSCTGMEFCNLALTETKERMKNLAEYLDREVSIDVPVRIHMTGCTNSCAQRHIADLGIQGLLMKTKDKGMIQAFELYVGGTLNNGGKFNEKLKGKIPGEQLPEVVKAFLIYFKDKKEKGESFFDFVQRVGIETLQNVLDDILLNVNQPTS